MKYSDWKIEALLDEGHEVNEWGTYTKQMLWDMTNNLSIALSTEKDENEEKDRVIKEKKRERLRKDLEILKKDHELSMANNALSVAWKAAEDNNEAKASEIKEVKRELLEKNQKISK